MGTPHFLYPDPGPDHSDSRPCFNATGKRVVFQREVGNNKPSLYIVDVTPDGTGVPKRLRPLPGNPPDASNNASRPDWSWHDHTIAFSGSHGGKDGLFLVDPDGTNLEHIPVSVGGVAITGSGISYPAWHPQGKHITVSDYNDHRVLKVTLPSGDAEQWTDPSIIQTGQSSVNQSASDEICAAAQVAGIPYNQDHNHVWFQPNVGATPYCVQVPGHGYGRAPWWSPSGHFIAFESDYNVVDGRYAIYLYRRHDQSLTRVTPREDWNCAHAKFHPTKNQIVVGANHVGDRAGIAIVDIGVAVVAPL